MILYKKFSFDAAHFLPNVPVGHKCNQLHGHTYTMAVHVKGIPHERLGWVIDFSELTEAVKPVLEKLDHKLLNDISGLSNPTSEQLAIWLWDNIKPALPALCKIELNETPGSGVIYEGPAIV